MSAMTQQRQQVYVSDGFSEPMSAQHNFANNFDLDNPDAAMSAYQKYVIFLILVLRSSTTNFSSGSCTSTPSANSALPPT
jgi:hypothetical protein